MNNILKIENSIDKKILVVLSGGLDSTVLTYLAQKEFKEVTCLSFDFGLPLNKTFSNNAIEIKKAQTTTRKLNINHIIIDAKHMSDTLIFMQKDSNRFNQTVKDNKPQTAMPFRNLNLIAMALMVAQTYQFDVVGLGFQSQDNHTYWDTTNEFITMIQKIVDLSGSKIEIYTPFINMNKVEEIELGVHLGVDFRDTHTCYNPVIQDLEVKSCGVCIACIDRINNFEKYGMNDPIEYVDNVCECGKKNNLFEEN